MIVPLFLVERLVIVGEDDIRYSINNPGLLTYHIYTLAGRVRFQNSSSSEKEMVREVELRPFRGWSVEHVPLHLLQIPCWLVQSRHK